jgi:hypothetical protein
VADRNALDNQTIGGILELLPEDERYTAKYVTICLKNGTAGQVDRDSLIAALEMFGQVRDSGYSPESLMQQVGEKIDKLAPAAKAKQIGASAEVKTARPANRSKKIARAAKATVRRTPANRRGGKK